MGRLADWLNSDEAVRLRAEIQANREAQAYFTLQNMDLARHLEEFAAAYCKTTDIPPTEAVLYWQDDLTKPGVRRFWFGRREER